MSSILGSLPCNGKFRRNWFVFVSSSNPCQWSSQLFCPFKDNDSIDARYKRARAPSRKRFRKFDATGDKGFCSNPLPMERTMSQSPSSQIRETKRSPGRTGLLFLKPPSWNVPKEWRRFGLKILKRLAFLRQILLYWSVLRRCRGGASRPGHISNCIRDDSLVTYASQINISPLSLVGGRCLYPEMLSIILQ